MFELYPEKKERVKIEILNPYPAWVESLKVFLFFYGGAVAMFFLSYLPTKDYRAIWFSFPFFLYPGLVRSQRDRTKNIPVYLALHLPLGIWIFLSPSLSAILGGMAFVAAWLIYSGVTMWKREVDQAASMLILYLNMALHLVILYATMTEECPAFRGTLAVFVVVYGVIFLYYSHWISVYDILKDADQHSNYSQKQCINWNDKLFWSYLALVIVGLGLIAIVFWSEISWLLNGSLTILWWLLEGIMWLFGCNREVKIDSWEYELELGEEPVTKTSDFWLLLEIIFKFVVVIGLLTLIIYMAYKLITRVKTTRRFEATDYEEEKVYYNSLKHKKKSSIRQGMARFFDHSYENRIRKEYYKKVRLHMGDEVQASDTPKEVGGKLEELQKLVHIYNEVRYGNENIKENK